MVDARKFTNEELISAQLILTNAIKQSFSTKPNQRNEFIWGTWFPQLMQVREEIHRRQNIFVLSP